MDTREQPSNPFAALPVIQPGAGAAGGEELQAGRGTERVVLQVQGMHCAGCVVQVERALEKVPGVVEARVNLATGNAAVACRAETDRAAMTAAIRAVGFEAAVSDTDYRQQLRAAQSAAEIELARWRQRFWEGLVWLGLLIGLHWVTRVTLAVPHLYTMLFQSLIATYLIVRVGAPYVLSAVTLLKRGRANMDTLIAVGSLTAYLYGLYASTTMAPGAMHFMDMGMILVFVTLGRYLELRARGRMSSAIYDLMSLTPDVVLIQNGTEIKAIALEQVQVGQHCVIRPGDRIPLDGTIVQGDSRIDASWLTGESHKLPKTVGDEVQAGSLNGDGVLVVRVDRVSTDSAIARVTRLVQRAQESKASVQRLADRLAAWFVPVVLVLAFVTFITWWMAASWQTALGFAVAVTVVSCPCALGLATPTAVIAAVHSAARQGVLIKNAQSLETAHRTSAIVFDKTGTMTHGPPLVHAVESVGLSGSDLSENDARGFEEPNGELPQWFWVASALERHSSHPLAAAICDYADKHRSSQPREFPSVDQIVSLPGEGMSGRWGPHQVYVGSEVLLRRFAIPTQPTASSDSTSPAPQASSSPKANGEGTRQQVAYVAIDGRHVGTVRIVTVVDPQAGRVVAELKQLGLLTAILTGDRASSARHVAQITGVDRVDSDATPEDKYRQIKSLQSAGHVVAMVGDGINDAAGLALSDLGIAMGAGADVALESADIVLVHSRLEPVVFIVRLARRTWTTIRMNLVWALIYNVLLIPVAAGLLVPLGGFSLPPAWAAAAMAASSVTVVLNSLRLARFE